MRKNRFRLIFILILSIITINVVVSQKATRLARPHDTLKRLTDSSSKRYPDGAIKSIKNDVDTNKSNEDLTRQVKNDQGSGEKSGIIKKVGKEIFVDLLGHAFWALITLI